MTVVTKRDIIKRVFQTFARETESTCSPGMWDYYTRVGRYPEIWDGLDKLDPETCSLDDIKALGIGSVFTDLICCVCGKDSEEVAVAETWYVVDGKMVEPFEEDCAPAHVCLKCLQHKTEGRIVG